MIEEEQKIIDLENEISFLKNILYEKQQEIEELKDTLKCTQNSWYKDTKLIQKQEKDYISKDKIKEKIKELEKDIEIYDIYEENWNKINVLKELLEEK